MIFTEQESTTGFYRVSVLISRSGKRLLWKKLKGKDIPDRECRWRKPPPLMRGGLQRCGRQFTASPLAAAPPRVRILANFVRGSAPRIIVFEAAES
jgi:hypothetical protein